MDRWIQCSVCHYHPHSMRSDCPAPHRMAGRTTIHCSLNSGQSTMSIWHVHIGATIKKSWGYGLWRETKLKWTAINWSPSESALEIQSNDNQKNIKIPKMTKDYFTKHDGLSGAVLVLCIGNRSEPVHFNIEPNGINIDRIEWINGRVQIQWIWKI